MAKRLSSGFKALSAHAFRLEITPMVNVALLELWIQNNCEGEYYIHQEMYSKYAKFFLWNDVDAMAFKLRWL